jgi:hypothetical protein
MVRSTVQSRLHAYRERPESAHATPRVTNGGRARNIRDVNCLLRKIRAMFALWRVFFCKYPNTGGLCSFYRIRTTYSPHPAATTSGQNWTELWGHLPRTFLFDHSRSQIRDMVSSSIHPACRVRVIGETTGSPQPEATPCWPFGGSLKSNGAASGSERYLEACHQSLSILNKRGFPKLLDVR